MGIDSNVVFIQFFFEFLMAFESFKILRFFFVYRRERRGKGLSVSARSSKTIMADAKLLKRDIGVIVL